MLYSFRLSPNIEGVPLAGLIFDKSGALYGTTTLMVFKLTPPRKGSKIWIRTVLYRFGTNANDGARPVAGLISDKSGALYGTTQNGGAAGNFGTVFKLSPPPAGKTDWKETVLYRFMGKAAHDGALPSAGLTFDGQGALYGTTYKGGDSDFGTVFKLTPPPAGKTAWKGTVLHSFKGKSARDGAFAVAGLIFDRAGALYGTTGNGGDNDLGTVFRLAPPRLGGDGKWVESVLHSFAGSPNDGAIPVAGLKRDQSGAFYGTTVQGGPRGGAAGGGTVFKLTRLPTGQTKWIVTLLHSFDWFPNCDDTNPTAGVIFDKNGALYGTASAGGPSFPTVGNGTVFKLAPPAKGNTQWTETVLHDFGSPGDGTNPQAGLVFDTQGALYGTTLYGGMGPANSGTVFKITGATTPDAGMTGEDEDQDQN